jgi:hypothetical protein
MNNKLDPSSNVQQLSLKLLTKTWTRDSHGLFDYEAQNIRSSLLIINERGKLIRRKHEVKFVAESHEIDLEERELSNIYVENGKHLAN